MHKKNILTGISLFFIFNALSVKASDFYSEAEKVQLNAIFQDDYIIRKKEEDLSQMAHSRIQKIKELSLKEMREADKEKLKYISWPDESLWLQYKTEKILNEKREKKK